MSKKRKFKAKHKSGSSKNSMAAELKEKIRVLFGKNPTQEFSIRQVQKQTYARDKKAKEKVKEILFQMERDGKLKTSRSGNFMSAKDRDALIGRVDHVNAKFAYVIVEGREDDVWISANDLNGAVDGDEVKIIITRQSSGGRREEGQVSEILTRGRDEIVGRIEISEKFAFVIPDSKKYHFDVFVYPEKTADAVQNDKVIVKINKWSDDKNKNPVGEVIRVLGAAGENDAEIHSIMAEFNLPFEFPDNVMRAAEKISEEIPEKEIGKRKDLREITTFTIDPHDAKDFDDALSLRHLNNGHIEIGVHIADVSHYVKPDTLLDDEAIHRATSVYLVDRTIPMLPEKLSNNLCSLRPNEDKLTFSAIFELDNDGKIHKEWFGRTIIHSDRRFTYEEAQERIESGEGDFHEEILLMNDLAKKIKSKRFKNGAINFETVEVKFKLDENGKPLGIVPKVRQDAHKLIEEFMLLANKRVAEFVYGLKNRSAKGQNTFVYRV
ncbi:MAG: RNB domain-containing ribonuclease, partial [Cyclobacteriaceae bacterium]